MIVYHAEVIRYHEPSNASKVIHLGSFLDLKSAKKAVGAFNINHNLYGHEDEEVFGSVSKVQVDVFYIETSPPPSILYEYNDGWKWSEDFK